MATRDYTIYAGIDRAAQRRRLRRRERVRTTCIVGTAGVALLLGGQALLTRDRIVPGVEVGGVDVGGLSQSTARARLATALDARLGRPLTVIAGGRRFRLVPSQLGIGVDAGASAERAFGTGRLAERLMPYVYSAHVEPAIVYTGATLPGGIVALDRRPRDARALVAADGGVRVVPAVAGVRFDREDVLRRIARAALAGSSDLTLAAPALPPAISTAAAARTASRLRALLAAPVALRWHGRSLGRLGPVALAGLVRTTPAGDDYRLTLDRAGLARALRAPVAPVERPSHDATWRTDGANARIVPSRDGLVLDPARTASSILRAGLAADRTARVWLEPQKPALSTQAARALGIREKVAAVTTDLGDSSANRIFNVGLMARFLDGQVVKPGGVFDFNGRVGPRTTDRGFKEGQAIVGGLLLPSIGGGVCQVATTVYDAAFYGGYPILERRNHDFYISHYAVGMDATVAWGGLNLRFRNDSKYGILIRASATASTMSVAFYSTSRGLTVTKETGTPQNYVSPKPRYLLNRSLKGAASQQRTGGERGFTVTVTRIISRGGRELKRDSFSSFYTADPIIYAVGPQFVPPDDGRVDVPPPNFSF